MPKSLNRINIVLCLYNKMSFKNLNASQKKMYLFAIYTIDTLKTQGIVREDFDTFHVDLSLIESFDYDAYSNEYKSHFKKPRAAKILKHSPNAVRDSSDDVVVSVANAFYENEDNSPICFDMNNVIRDNGAGVAAVEVAEVVAEKPKRKYNRKPKVDALAAASPSETEVAEVVSASNIDSMLDGLTASLNDMRIELNTISTDIQTNVVTEVVSEKPKRKYNRKSKADTAAAAASPVDDMESLTASMNAMNVDATAATTATSTAATEVDDVTAATKPKRKNTKQPKAKEVVPEITSEVSTANEVVEAAAAEKPKRKNTKQPKAKDVVEVSDKVVTEVSAAAATATDDEVPEKPKRKYTKKTAVQYIDESVPEIAAKIVTAAIQGTNEVAAATAATEDMIVDENQNPTIHICIDSTHEESQFIVRSGTPIMDHSCEEEEEAYVEDDNSTVCDHDEYEDIVTRKVNIRGKDYLIDENNKVYDYVTQKTVGKYSSDDVKLF